MSVGPLDAGLFGKLPAHGDFVARGDPALVRWFEGWLTQGLAALALVHDPLDAALARAPVWRFALRRESGALAGALLPSRDKVGRLFPLLLFATCQEGDAPALADAIAALPLGMTTEADEAIAAIAAAVPADGEGRPGWPERNVWSSETGDELVCDALPIGVDFARLFAVVEAAA